MLAAAGAIFGLLFLVYYFGYHYGEALDQALGPIGWLLAEMRRLLAWLAVWLVAVLIIMAVGAVLLVVMAFVLLFKVEHTYLYEDGLVRWRSGFIRVLPWRDLTGVERVMALGMHTGYKLHTRTGGAIEIQISSAQGGEMGRRLMTTLRAAGH